MEHEENDNIPVPEEPRDDVRNKVRTLEEEKEEIRKKIKAHIEAKEKLKNMVKRKINQLIDLLNDIKYDVLKHDPQFTEVREMKRISADIMEMLNETLELQALCKTRKAEIEEALKSDN